VQPSPAASPDPTQGLTMSDHLSDDDADSTGPEPIPAMQQVLDNPFLLLFLGITIPTVFYVIWGVMEIVTIPMAR
jgi:hypothetical protein